jgi:hypothetical protein
MKIIYKVVKDFQIFIRVMKLINIKTNGMSHHTIYNQLNLELIITK